MANEEDRTGIPLDLEANLPWVHGFGVDRDDPLRSDWTEPVAFLELAKGLGVSMANLTAAINLLPNRYGRLESLNLFPVKPVRFRQILIEEKNGVLNLLPTLPVGSPGTVGQRDKRKMRSFVVPHIPHDDVVLPEEVQGLRAFGSESELETVAGVMARHLETMRRCSRVMACLLRMVSR